MLCNFCCYDYLLTYLLTFYWLQCSRLRPINTNCGGIKTNLLECCNYGKCVLYHVSRYTTNQYMSNCKRIYRVTGQKYILQFTDGVTRIVCNRFVHAAEYSSNCLSAFTPLVGCQEGHPARKKSPAVPFDLRGGPGLNRKQYAQVLVILGVLAGHFFYQTK